MIEKGGADRPAATAIKVLRQRVSSRPYLVRLRFNVIEGRARIPPVANKTGLRRSGSGCRQFIHHSSPGRWEDATAGFRWSPAGLASRSDTPRSKQSLAGPSARSLARGQPGAAGHDSSVCREQVSRTIRVLESNGAGRAVAFEPFIARAIQRAEAEYADLLLVDLSS